MDNSQLQLVLSTIKDLESNYDFSDNIEKYIDKDDLLACETVEEIVEYIRGLNDESEITNTEITYYSNAIEYLSENDPSLQESLGLASDL